MQRDATLANTVHEYFSLLFVKYADWEISQDIGELMHIREHSVMRSFRKGSFKIFSGVRNFKKYTQYKHVQAANLVLFQILMSKTDLLKIERESLLMRKFRTNMSASQGKNVNLLLEQVCELEFGDKLQPRPVIQNPQITSPRLEEKSIEKQNNNNSLANRRKQRHKRRRQKLKPEEQMELLQKLKNQRKQLRKRSLPNYQKLPQLPAIKHIEERTEVTGDTTVRVKTTLDENIVKQPHRRRLPREIQQERERLAREAVTKMKIKQNKDKFLHSLKTEVRPRMRTSENSREFIAKAIARDLITHDSPPRQQRQGLGKQYLSVSKQRRRKYYLVGQSHQRAPQLSNRNLSDRYWDEDQYKAQQQAYGVFYRDVLKDKGKSAWDKMESLVTRSQIVQKKLDNLRAIQRRATNRTEDSENYNLQQEFVQGIKAKMDLLASIL